MVTRRNARSFALRASAAVFMTLGLSACFLGSDQDAAEGIGFREARFQEMQATRDYRACKAEGMDLDRKALASGSAGTYLASAQVLEKCETKLGPGTVGDISVGERMRAYALSIQNYLKGGDVARARDNFDRYRKAFPDNDLYYADGTSFSSTMEALLGRQEPWSFGEFANLNVPDSLKSEMRRMNYWKDK